MSIINAISKRHKVRDFFMCWYFSFYEQLIISCSVELSMKEKLGVRCRIQLMAQFRIFPSSESRHSFVANYTSAVKFKIHILVLFCCINIPLFVSESKYL